MNPRADSAQLVSALGAVAGFVGANFDRVAATLCALVCAAYTLWKWRRAAADQD